MKDLGHAGRGEDLGSASQGDLGEQVAWAQDCGCTEQEVTATWVAAVVVAGCRTGSIAKAGPDIAPSPGCHAWKEHGGLVL